MTIRRDRKQEYQAADQRSALVSLLQDFRAQKIDRRSFLTKISVLLAVSSLPLVARVETVAAESNEPWLTIAAVQDQLFPTTANAPGAKEINATDYLRRVLSESHTDPDDKQFILNGVGWLNDLAREKQGLMYYELNEEQGETVLREIEKSGAGERWLAFILLYVFEALLSAPVYGGNPDAVGWRWLEHQPGFPLPTADKTYFKL